MQRDQRVLELGRCLADDRFAVTVDTVDIIAADILRRVAHRAARGRTTVNPLFNLARAVQLLIQAFGPQEAATRIRLECGAIISVRERVAHVIAFPRPACLGDRHSVYDAGLGTLNADFYPSIGQAHPVAGEVAAALAPSGDELIENGRAP